MYEMQRKCRLNGWFSCLNRTPYSRFVPEVPDVPDEDEEPYGDSESESDDDLDSVSVIADRTRDRLSGTGSTHSQDSGDSGICTSQPRTREKYEEPKGKSKRPDSAVPSEISTVSDTSSLEGSEEKTFSETSVRPLVTISKPSEEEIPEEINSGGSSQTKPSFSQASGEEATRLSKAFSIASELLNTEKHYVAILHLIDQVGT